MLKVSPSLPPWSILWRKSGFCHMGASDVFDDEVLDEMVTDAGAALREGEAPEEEEEEESGASFTLF